MNTTSFLAFAVGITHQGRPVSDEMLRVCAIAYLKHQHKLQHKMKDGDDEDEASSHVVDEREIRMMMLEVRMACVVSSLNILKLCYPHH